MEGLVGVVQGDLGRELWEPPDLPVARHWLELAAAAGHTDAADKLGVLPPSRQTMESDST